jgi:hypothetical protein
MGRLKQPEPEAKRGRRSNTEILKISAAAMREMRQLAAESRMPLDQVHDDVVNIGLCEVRRILYDNIITARKEIESRLNVKVEQTTGNGGPGVAGADLGNRSDSEGSLDVASGRGHESSESFRDDQRHSDAPELSGFGSEDAESAVVAARQDGVSGSSDSDDS